MTEPKTLTQLADETKAFIRDLVAEAGEIRKHPSIIGLPDNLFSGFDAARQRLDNHLRDVEATDIVATADQSQPTPGDPGASGTSATAVTGQASGSHAATDPAPTATDPKTKSS